MGTTGYKRKLGRPRKKLDGHCVVLTNLTQQISRRFPGDSSDGLQEKFRICLHCFSLLCYVLNLLHLVEHVMMSSNQRSLLCYSTDYNISYIFNKRSGTQFYDWKPIRSIIDILHKNFQEDHTNSTRFPGRFLNSSRFPGAVDTLHCQTRSEGYGN